MKVTYFPLNFSTSGTATCRYYASNTWHLQFKSTPPRQGSNSLPPSKAFCVKFPTPWAGTTFNCPWVAQEGAECWSFEFIGPLVIGPTFFSFSSDTCLLVLYFYCKVFFSATELDSLISQLLEPLESNLLPCSPNSPSTFKMQTYHVCPIPNGSLGSLYIGSTSM